jgi:predicted RNA-binding protein with TRAM domain
MSFAPTGSAEPVEPADPVEPGEPLEAPVRAAANRGSGSERVAGFALALGALKAGAGPGSLPAADRSRVRRAVRRLARDGWSDERIAQRLRLDPVEVERTLAPARTGVSN